MPGRILDLVASLCILPSAASDLVRNHGLLLWLKQNRFQPQMLSILESLVDLKWSSQYQYELTYVVLNLLVDQMAGSSLMYMIKLFRILKDILVKMTDGDKTRVFSLVEDQIWQPAMSLQNPQVDQVLIDLLQMKK